MNSENDELRTQLARLKALPVGDPPPLSELRRRIERRRRHAYWAALAVVCTVVISAGAIGVRVAARRATPASGQVSAPSQPGEATTLLVTIGGAPAGLSVVDTGAGTVRQVVAPADARGPLPLLLLPPHRAVFVGDAPATAGTGGYGVFAVDLDDPGPAVLLGKGAYFVPSAHRGRVWVVDSTSGPAATVREVTASGTVSVPDTRVPDGIVVGATSKGLILAAATPHGPQASAGVLRVWDPGSGRVVTTIPDDVPVSADGDLVASCRTPCTALTITNVRTGKHLSVVPPHDSPYVSGILEGIGEGAFSPDARRLAVWVLPRPQELQGPARVAVIDVTNGALTSSSSTISRPAALAWSSDSGRVFFSAGAAGLNWDVGAFAPGHGVTRLKLPPVTLAQPQAFAVESP